MGYNYDIEYIVSTKNCADALSRIPSEASTSDTSNDIKYLNFVEQFLPITNDEVRKATAKDILLNRIKLYVESGWPTVCPDEEVKPYFTRRYELYVECGCVMWGYRIVIPTSLRLLILKQLNSGHMGIVKSKSCTRGYIWWPRIDEEIEATCRNCETCSREQNAPPRSPSHPWPYTSQPWTRIHVDFLGSILGKTYFLLIDAYSKWFEIVEMRQTNAVSGIGVLHCMFAISGCL
ncbi:unnamed protein product [Parnassius mnemosyne]|uniref:RNA-directed DNA polymerase n=1 Tax=Parnassius mnemosyne TaxID=213953 RepID=A0AAV1LK55_9NEOP